VICSILIASIDISVYIGNINYYPSACPNVILNARCVYFNGLNDMKGMKSHGCLDRDCDLLAINRAALM